MIIDKVPNPDDAEVDRFPGRKVCPCGLEHVVPGYKEGWACITLEYEANEADSES